MCLRLDTILTPTVEWTSSWFRVTGIVQGLLASGQKWQERRKLPTSWQPGSREKNGEQGRVCTVPGLFASNSPLLTKPHLPTAHRAVEHVTGWTHWLVPHPAIKSPSKALTMSIWADVLDLQYSKASADDWVLRLPSSRKASSRDKKTGGSLLVPFFLSLLHYTRTHQQALCMKQRAFHLAQNLLILWSWICQHPQLCEINLCYL